MISTHFYGQGMPSTMAMFVDHGRCYYSTDNDVDHIKALLFILRIVLVQLEND